MSSAEPIQVACNGNVGTYLPSVHLVACDCVHCRDFAAERGLARLELSPTQFEAHSGRGATKKWKFSIVETKGNISLGEWLLRNGVAHVKVQNNKGTDVRDLPLATAPRRTPTSATSSSMPGPESDHTTAAEVAHAAGLKVSDVADIVSPHIRIMEMHRAMTEAFKKAGVPVMTGLNCECKLLRMQDVAEAKMHFHGLVVAVVLGAPAVCEWAAKFVEDFIV